MCGIFGVLRTGPRGQVGPDEVEVVARQLAALRHRGPDHRAHVTLDGAVLGAARLRIVDLRPEADLPMRDESGAVALAYNGEVTNHRALRSRHDLDGRFAMRTRSDAEVLLRLYQLQGIACVSELSGMFAFCLADDAARRAWLVRDPFGQRPLYYLVGEGRLWFSSEIDALRAAPEFEPSLDLEGFHHFLGLGYFPGERTPFAKVCELRPGRLLEVDLAGGGFVERRHHRVRYEPDAPRPVAALASELRDRLRDAVARNLDTDAPLGLTLSGGVDTTTVLALSREVLGPRAEIQTFSVEIDDPSFDERRWQRVAVERYGTVHRAVRVGPAEILADLESHLRHLHEPSADGAVIPFYALARLASPHVRALLSGEAGDEVFNAYETHLAHRVRGLYRAAVPRPLRRLARACADAMPCSYRKLSVDFLAKRFTRGAELDAPEAHLYWRHVLLDPMQREVLVGAPDAPPTSTLFRAVWDEAAGPDSLDRISAIDLEHYFVDDLMTKNDRMMMAHSIEARFPLADRELFDFVRRVPASLRLRGLTRRYLQKRAMASTLPPEIAGRANMGLEMPHSRWFLKALRPLAEEYLARDNVERTGLFRHAPIARLWAEHASHRVDHGRPLWALIHALVWFDLFVDRGPASARLAARLRAGR